MPEVEDQAAEAEFGPTSPVVAGLSIRYLRILASCEAVCFLLLITFGVIHANNHHAAWASDALFVMGNVHGGVFTLYLVSIVVFNRKLDWGPLTLLFVLLCGFIPGGGIVAERWALADSHVLRPGEKRKPWLARYRR